MDTYIIASTQKWHQDHFTDIGSTLNCNIVFIGSSEELNIASLKKINPKYIFFTHWSTKISKDIYDNFNCILFHMTDLPYGRGGSPLQNLILKGHAETKISAIKVVEALDAGDVYLKKELKLKGSAQEILLRAANVVKDMIIEIIKTNPKPSPQVGPVEIFKRRKPEESDIKSIADLNLFYDYIRMLDADGYPKAFLETEHFKFEFNKAELNTDNTLSAHVRIIKK